MIGLAFFYTDYHTNEKNLKAVPCKSLFLLVRPLNTLFNLNNDVKSRSAGAGFPVMNT